MQHREHTNHHESNMLWHLYLSTFKGVDTSAFLPYQDKDTPKELRLMGKEAHGSNLAFSWAYVHVGMHVKAYGKNPMLHYFQNSCS